MKKLILLLVFTFVFGFSFTSCDGDGQENQKNEPETPPIRIKNKALLIIDVQNDYFEGGSNALYEPLVALGNIESVLEKFRDEGLPVFHVQHINGAGNSLFAEGTWGVEIHENITPLENEIVITKNVVSSFSNSNLEELLREAGITDLIICGMQSNICINSAVREASEFVYEIVLLEDSCAAASLETHEKAINNLHDFANVLNTKEYLQEQWG